jgi:hypothetical protein
MDIRRNILFMHGSAPAHFSCAGRNCYETFYTGRWIRRQGPVSRPSCSPDLKTYVFLYLNNLVYAAAVDIAEELLQRFQNPRRSKFLAFFGASVNPCIVGPKLLCQWKANI